MRYCIILIFSLLTLQVNSQNYLDANEFHYRFFNGLTFMLLKDTSATDLHMNLTFSTGAVTEQDSINGLNYLFAQSLFASGNPAAKSPNDIPFFTQRNIDFDIRAEREQVTFHFQLKKQYLQETLAFIQSTLSEYPANVPDSSLLMSWINEEQNQKHDSKYNLANELISSELWGIYYNRREIFPTMDSTMGNQSQKLTEVYGRFYCPGNGLLVIKGDLEVRTLKKEVQSAMMNIEPCSFFHLYRYPIPNHRYFMYTRQTVFEEEVDTPYIQLTYQGPTVAKSRQGTLAAIALQVIFENRSSNLYRYIVDSTYISHIDMSTEYAYHSNEMVFTLYADSNKLDSARIQWYSLINSGKWLDQVSDADLAQAKLQLTAEFQKAKNGGRSAVDLISTFWTSSSIDHYSSYTDSIATLPKAALNKFSDYYLNKTPHLAALFINESDRKALATDSFFAETAAHVNEYEFRFLKNTADFVNEQQDSVLQSLVQYLKVNPKLKVKVNGLVSKDELLHIKDDEMSAYVDSHGSMRIHPEKTVCGPKIRLDVYRALTIIKKLEEAGLPKEQLFGEGVIINDPKEKENAQRAYCTLLTTVQLREE